MSLSARLVKLHVTLCCALLVLTGGMPCASTASSGRQEVTASESRANGRYLLMDLNGRAVTNADFPGRFQLISFGYTYCPDICPTTLTEQTAIMQRLGPRAEQIQPIFISVDPERDTPERLRTYAAYFDPHLIALTGPPELIRAAAHNFGVRYQKVIDPNAPADRYPVDHSAGMYLLAPDGGYVGKFGYGTGIETISERIEALLSEHPGNPGR